MQNLRLLLEWFPLVPLVTAMGDARPGLPRVIAAMQVLRFIAGKTAIKQDDELLRLLEDVLLTEQGRALVEYASEEVRRLLEQTNGQ